MNKTRVLLLIFLIMALSFLVTGCPFHPKTSLMILAYHLEKAVVDGELTAEIKGAAVNHGSTRLEYAEVIGRFYDKDGTLVHSGVNSTTNLGPGDIWEFTIPFISSPRDVHPSLNILSWYLEVDSSGARVVGEAQNNGDVMLSFAEIIATFYAIYETEDSEVKEVELASGTATTTMLGVGEIWEFTIFCPAPNFEDVHHVKVVTNIKYESEPAQDVDHVSVEVGRLSGSTIMP